MIFLGSDLCFILQFIEIKGLYITSALLDEVKFLKDF